MNPSGRPKPPLILTDEERDALVRYVARRNSSQGLARRARIVLACAENKTNIAVAAEVGCSVPTVGLWRKRFIDQRLDGLFDLPRPGAPRKISDDQVEAIVVKTLEDKPADATHWSTRGMASAMGVSQSSVTRIWQAFRLKPHRQDHFKLSTDPLVVEKVRDIVGLYLAPPERAVVLCVDEKSQIQALSRSHPIFPMMPGSPEKATHDYKRHGTTTLFAALDYTTGKILSSLGPRHRAIEFKKFLVLIDKNTPAELDIHLVLDNYATHKTPTIKKWLEKHPRFHLHFTPTSGSWLNLVERWLGELTQKKIKRGSHFSVKALEADIRNWIENPKPFVWHKTADEILDSLAAYCTHINNGTN
jgi:transposase